MAGSWKLVGELEGSIGEIYRISRRLTKDGAVGEWGCSCPKWRFSKAPKPDCKHIIAYKRKIEQEVFAAIPPLDMSLTSAPIKLRSDKLGATWSVEVNPTLISNIYDSASFESLREVFTAAIIGADTTKRQRIEELKCTIAKLQEELRVLEGSVTEALVNAATSVGMPIRKFRFDEEDE